MTDLQKKFAFSAFMQYIIVLLTYNSIMKGFFLSEIMDIIGGGTPKTSKSEYWDGDIPWLSVKDFNDENKYVYTTEMMFISKK